MNIKEICIGDSQIIEYKLENQILTMILQDYTETLYEITMNECGYILVKGSVGFSLSDAKFKRNKKCDNWFFYDADGEVMEIHFNGYKIRKI